MKLPDDQPGVNSIVEYLGVHPTRPKEKIATAMGELGFRIPDIFENHKEAISSGQGFVARSEGPDELHHSGLKLSIDTRKEREIAWLESMAPALEDPARTFRSITAPEIAGRMGFIEADAWMRMADGDTNTMSTEQSDQLARSNSLSYWQAAEGDNLYIAADNARHGRYYMGRMNKWAQSFTVVLDAEVETHATYYGAPGRSAEVPNIEKLVEFYEKVRQAPVFDSGNAAVVELVDPGSEEEPFFLQYFPTQSTEAADFEVNKSQEHILFVRGATDQDGIEVTLHHEPITYQKMQKTPDFESAVDHSSGRREYVLPRTTLQTLPGRMGLGSPDIFLKGIGMSSLDHDGRSLLFKPRVTIGLSEAAYKLLWAKDQPSQKTKRAHIVSDGEHAFLQFFNESEKRIVTLG